MGAYVGYRGGGREERARVSERWCIHVSGVRGEGGGWCICARGEGVREDGAYVQEGRG